MLRTLKTLSLVGVLAVMGGCAVVPAAPGYGPRPGYYGAGPGYYGAAPGVVVAPPVAVRTPYYYPSWGFGGHYGYGRSYGHGFGRGRWR